ncbi:hypothetical protein CROQUDRAFT_101258 [Cronartium quercuum f. sp. fusiforme G11]|uniref:Uncharacterized protein n=1 Tax=Cronartium quercuum f. sp. fusiforme G11 TaxID=708437 RepID=A0A9P6T6P8_9BASI|nr:hypothetical protein CROQUDRAFT_101258 [Cronartium quercuum f. sp. fusiforme G11]
MRIKIGPGLQDRYLKSPGRGPRTPWACPAPGASLDSASDMQAPHWCLHCKRQLIATSVKAVHACWVDYYSPNEVSRGVQPGAYAAMARWRMGPGQVRLPLLLSIIMIVILRDRKRSLPQGLLLKPEGTISIGQTHKPRFIFQLHSKLLQLPDRVSFNLELRGVFVFIGNDAVAYI